MYICAMRQGKSACTGGYTSKENAVYTAGSRNQIFERGKENMVFKKYKAVLAAALSAAVVSSSMLPLAASAAGTRTKDEAYGDETYAQRFLSLYDDVVTNGQENG